MNKQDEAARCGEQSLAPQAPEPQGAEQLRRLRSFCRLLERAVSLATNGAKTKVVAVNAEAAAAARRESRLAGSPLSGMGVVGSARHLGLMVMAEGSVAWAPPVAKLESRVQWVKLLGCSMVSRVRRYNMYCMSILRYWRTCCRSLGSWWRGSAHGTP